MDCNLKKLPKTVYYQCVWTVKDLDRLERIATRWEDVKSNNAEELIIYNDRCSDYYPEHVIVNAMFKISCIYEAIETIPEEYREGILNNIKNLNKFSDNAHDNTWRKWKHRFICKLAENLGLC